MNTKKCQFCQKPLQYLESNSWRPAGYRECETLLCSWKKRLASGEESFPAEKTEKQIRSALRLGELAMTIVLCRVAKEGLENVKKTKMSKWQMWRGIGKAGAEKLLLAGFAIPDAPRKKIQSKSELAEFAAWVHLEHPELYKKYLEYTGGE